jgi:uncharacterized protein YkwD
MRGRYGSSSFYAAILAVLVLGSGIVASASGAARPEPPRPPSSLRQLLPPEAIERALFESVNKERAARDLPALRLSSPLSDVARQHSEEMARLGRLSHESAAGGTLKERLERARIANALSAENVARGDSFDPALIHEALMGSEGHRENILLPNVDEVGIGVALGPDGDHYVTQDFLRSVTWLDETDAGKAVLAVLDEARRDRGLAPLAVLDELSRKARTFARLKAEGRDLPSLPREFGEVRVDFYAGVEIEGIAARIKEQALERYGMAGVGVHIGPAPGYPSGAYQVCTLLLAADPVLLRDESARVRTVLQAVNTVRQERGLGRLELDAALSAKADNFGRRTRGMRAASGRAAFRQGSSRLGSEADAGTVIVIYETADLGRLAPGISGQVAGRDTRKVGISVKPAGPGLTVYFTVVLMFVD